MFCALIKQYPDASHTTGSNVYWFDEIFKAMKS